MQLNKHFSKKRIAIVSYDDNRGNLIEWSYFNREKLRVHHIIANDGVAEVLTGTLTVPVTTLPARTLGGYSQLLKMIGDNEIDILICLGNSLQEKHLLTGISDLCFLATRKGIIVAGNEATADFVIDSLSATNSESDNIVQSHSADTGNISGRSWNHHLKMPFFRHFGWKPWQPNFRRPLHTNKKTVL
jgi:methylglyoxal synthase